jgi:hypothetical protein
MNNFNAVMLFANSKTTLKESSSCTIAGCIKDIGDKEIQQKQVLTNNQETANKKY